jgi:hypothetical protein
MLMPSPASGPAIPGTDQASNSEGDIRMDTHGSDAPVWTPHEPPADEEVVVIESHETGYEDDETGLHDGQPDMPEVAPAVAAARPADEPAAADAPAVTPDAPAATPDAPAVALDAQQWSEIKAMFVDDPGESVKLASGLVEQAIENLVSSLRQRHDSLSSWESGDASDTEGLRNVLRSYRSLYDQLDGMSSQVGSGHQRVS